MTFNNTELENAGGKEGKVIIGKFVTNNPRQWLRLQMKQLKHIHATAI